MNLRNQLLEKFSDKEYRDSFVQEFIFSRIPLKIRSMRDERVMSQAALGEKAGIAQPWVSKLEDPSYGRLTLSTLLKIASAFDVALYVDFVPFSEILNRSCDLSEDGFTVPSFAQDTELVATTPSDQSLGNALNKSGSKDTGNLYEFETEFETMKAALMSKKQDLFGQFSPPIPIEQTERGSAYAAISGTSR
jgi:transcriptional regulator with XRE-family HTH domain